MASHYDQASKGNPVCPHCNERRASGCSSLKEAAECVFVSEAVQKRFKILLAKLERRFDFLTNKIIKKDEKN